MNQAQIKFPCRWEFVVIVEQGFYADDERDTKAFLQSYPESSVSAGNASGSKYRSLRAGCLVSNREEVEVINAFFRSLPGFRMML